MEERELVLLSNMLKYAEAAARGDGAADREVMRSAMALIRWCGWTPDTVTDRLATFMAVTV